MKELMVYLVEMYKRIKFILGIGKVIAGLAITTLVITLLIGFKDVLVEWLVSVCPKSEKWIALIDYGHVVLFLVIIAIFVIGFLAWKELFEQVNGLNITIEPNEENQKPYHLSNISRFSFAYDVYVSNGTEMDMAIKAIFEQSKELKELNPQVELKLEFFSDLHPKTVTFPVPIRRKSSPVLRIKIDIHLNMPSLTEHQGLPLQLQRNKFAEISKLGKLNIINMSGKNDVAASIDVVNS